MVVPDILYVIGAGAALAAAGSLLRPKGVRIGYQPPPGPAGWLYFAGRVLYWCGVAGVVVGLCAGTLGPLAIGPVTLPPFEQKYLRLGGDSDARSYLTRNMTVTVSPSLGWRGPSKTTLRFDIENRGDRRVKEIVVRLAAEPGSGRAGVELKLWGPYFARSTKVVFARVPPQTARMYFQGRVVLHDPQIASARF